MYGLQQYLPLAVLKQQIGREVLPSKSTVATVLTACGIETRTQQPQPLRFRSCNSTYRLRY